MQKALDEQKVNIEAVMEFNEGLKTDNENLNETLRKLKEDHDKEKNRLIEEVRKEQSKRKEILTSLDSTDQDKVRTSQRIVTQDKEMDRMNMLYR